MAGNRRSAERDSRRREARPRIRAGPDEDVHSSSSGSSSSGLATPARRPAYRPVTQRAGCSLDPGCISGAAFRRATRDRGAGRRMRRTGRTRRNALMPSYTHLRRAQPVPRRALLLSHAAALRRITHVSPRPPRTRRPRTLGSGAVAGTSYPVDTARLASALGFSRIVRNSMDASSDSRFVASFLYGVVGGRWCT